MKIIPPRFDIRKGEARKPVLTIGNFDGLHTGHRKIIGQIIAEAKKVGGESALITFVPHPVRVLHPEVKLEVLTTLEQKVALLEEMGIDLLLLLAFTEELSKMPAEQFVGEFLVGRLGMVEIYVGSDFAFGHGHRGNPEMLKSLGKEMNFETHVVEKSTASGRIISSSRIRESVRSGEIVDAAEMLGRPYSVEGRVCKGAGRGKALGFPTINLEEVQNLLPAPGVYVTETRVGNKTFPSVSFLGSPLTYNDERRTVESHLLDYDRDLYGEWVGITFLRRLRPVEKFPDAEALRKAIAADVQKAREFFASSYRHASPDPTKS
jgi:riboflavin kinase/FMN adenylyltransferase